MSAKFDRALARIYHKVFRPDQFRDRTLRNLYKKAYDIDAGLYSYGCFDRDRFNPHVTIGRYCSFSNSCRRINANHGLDNMSMHPFFYNERMGFRENAHFERARCVIEDDVWIGHNAILLARVTRVGRGAAIAAGAIVTGDVPPYALVAGVPGKVVRYRFAPEVIEAIEATRWWELDETQLKQVSSAFPDAFADPTNNIERLAEVAKVTSEILNAN